MPALDDADDPSFCFDLGDGRLLLLRGQWLMDPEQLGAPPGYDSGDEDADTANFLPEPYAFPRTVFTITRAPHTGDVLAMQLAGVYLGPSKEVDVLKREDGCTDCVLLEGSLTDLRKALDLLDQKKR